MKIVKTYLYSYQAQLDLAKLLNEGIEAEVRDENIVSINPVYAQAVGGIKLLVSDKDYKTAVDVLNTNDYQYLKNEFSGEEIEEQRKCRRCGSTNILQKGSWLIGILFFILSFIPVAAKKSSSICLDCSFRWKEKNE
jgi:hypothetical protein